jgi:hypothetical protein
LKAIFYFGKIRWMPRIFVRQTHVLYRLPQRYHQDRRKCLKTRQLMPSEEA